MKYSYSQSQYRVDTQQNLKFWVYANQKFPSNCLKVAIILILFYLLILVIINEMLDGHKFIISNIEQKDFQSD